MKKMLAIIFSLFLLTLSSSTVMASGDSSNEKEGLTETLNTSITMEALICNVLGFLTGGVGKALAAFACMGIALAFLGGKVSWTLILTFSLGMACIFGAPTIIKAFTGGDAACSDFNK